MQTFLRYRNSHCVVEDQSPGFSSGPFGLELARAHNALHIGGSRFVRRPSERPWLHHQISVVNPRTSLIEVESKPLGWVFPTVLCFASLLRCITACLHLQEALPPVLSHPCLGTYVHRTACSERQTWELKKFPQGSVRLYSGIINNGSRW